jgi:hypothetical protein
MSNIKKYKEAVDLIGDVAELHYIAGNAFNDAIAAFDALGDFETREYLKVLFEQSKKFAGKLRQIQYELETNLD